MFGAQEGDHSIVGYVNSDYVGDLDNRRFTTGYVFTLAGGPICWRSVLSTIEAEYMALAEAANEALWIRGIVEELSVEQGGVEVQCYS